MVDSIGSRLKGYAPLMIRIGLALIMIVEGAGGVKHLGDHSAGENVRTAVQLLGGVFVLIGFLTRWAALGITIVIAIRIMDTYQVAILESPNRQVWFAVLMMGLGLYCSGGGQLSIDERQKRKEGK